MKNIIQSILKSLATYYVRSNKLEVVAITGSAGKTTTKAVLKHIYGGDPSIYVPNVGYNTESGIPLVIFGLTSPKNPHNPFAWIILIVKCFVKIMTKNKYKTIILEYGADSPGDIGYLVDIARPHIGVVTTVLPVHLEGFVSIEAVAKEKSMLLHKMTSDDFAILNFDNEYVKAMASETKASIFSIGKGDGCSLKYSQPIVSEKGIETTLSFGKAIVKLKLRIIAPQLLPSILSGIGVSLIRGAKLEEITETMKDFSPENGRMNLIKGKHGSIIIDDSYNSNPESAKAALDVLAGFSDRRRVAVLGSMNELGAAEKTSHREVADHALRCSDVIITVGETANKYIYPLVKEKIGDKKSFSFPDSFSAGEFLTNFTEAKDVLLFKGSQNGVLLEEAIKYVMLDRAKAKDILVRQTPMWIKKKTRLKRGN